MPSLTIIEHRGKISTPPFAILKDGREFAYAVDMNAARAIKVALEDWWLRSKKNDNV